MSVHNPIKDVRLAIAYARSLFHYALDNDPRPFSASFSVTNRCNIQCLYCGYPDMDRRYLSIDKIEVLFDRLHQLGVRRLGLCGGEPLVRKDINEITKLAINKKFFLTLNSNLILYEKNPEPALNSDIVFTSLDGDRESHIKNRGEGSYDGVIDAITDLVRHKKRVVAICVVTSNNMDSALGLLDDAARLGFQIHYQGYTEIPEVSVLDEQFIPEQAKWGRFWDSVIEQKRLGGPIASSLAYLEYMKNWEDATVSRFFDPHKKCAAGSGFIFVNPLGEASPCPVIEKEVPRVNLLENDWKTTFNKKLPCTQCNLGAMVEANILFTHPLSAPIRALKNYG